MDPNSAKGSEEAAAAAQKQAESREDAKNSMISRFLHQDAIVRLSNLAAAKPDKAKLVEAAILNMAQRGQIAGKMSDDGLKQLMERVSQQTEKATTVKFDRRRNKVDSDDDDDY